MELITKDELHRVINKKFDYPFVAPQKGLYAIAISARAKSEKQAANTATDDHDLRVEIDGRKFPQLANAQRYFDSPASFSGGQLHNLKKTVIFLAQFSKGKHAISFVPDGVPLLEEVSISYEGDRISSVDLDVNQQAEDGDRRPWITFVLVDLPLAEVQSVIRAERRFLDSDDVKIIIDDETKRNPIDGLGKFWFWLGAILNGEEQTNTFAAHLKRGLHYIEFWADRMPTLQHISFNFGEIVKRIPNVYDPEWTGDFHDDLEEVLLARLIFGEAEDQSRKAKVWIAGAVLNRVNAKAWPNTIHEVILQYKQYDPFRPDDPNFTKTTDPLENADKLRKAAWGESYEIARGLLSGKIQNPTEATHFHGLGLTREWFIKNVVPNGRFLKRIDDTYFYWSPN